MGKKKIETTVYKSEFEWRDGHNRYVFSFSWNRLTGVVEVDFDDDGPRLELGHMTQLEIAAKGPPAINSIQPNPVIVFGQRINGLCAIGVGPRQQMLTANEPEDVVWLLWTAHIDMLRAMSPPDAIGRALMLYGALTMAQLSIRLGRSPKSLQKHLACELKPARGSWNSKKRSELRWERVGQWNGKGENAPRWQLTQSHFAAEVQRIRGKTEGKEAAILALSMLLNAQIGK